MKIMKIINSLVGILILLSGCVATNPDAIMPKQKTNNYMEYSCLELEIKANEITSQSIELRKKLNDDSEYDNVMFAVGVLVAFPALFAIQGDDKDTTKIYSNIKGELFILIL